MMRQWEPQIAVLHDERTPLGSGQVDVT